MRKYLQTSIPVILGVIALTACGDDGVGTVGSEATVTGTGSAGATSTTMTDTSATTSETPPTTGETATTGETSTAMTATSATTDAAPTTGDESTTGEPAGCRTPGDASDGDADGVMNMLDNCRCDANPNQLDFDGDAVGNVCDAPMVFTAVEGAPPQLNQLETTAYAKKVLDCEFMVSLVVLDSRVEVALDDAGAGRVFAARVNYADTPELECDLGMGVIVKLRVEQFFADGVDPFAVGFPFTLSDHDAGVLGGATDAMHEILASAVINVTESPNPLFLPEGEEPLTMIPGVFPPAVLEVVGAGKQISLRFDDDDTVLFEQETPSGVTFKLTGLNGTLRLLQE